MKNYTITVNGTAYDVTVEEGGAGASAPAAPVKKAAAPAAAPKAAAPTTGPAKIPARILAGADLRAYFPIVNPISRLVSVISDSLERNFHPSFERYPQSGFHRSYLQSL